ncbi:MAG: L-dopachrome tautomerase-related protein [Myxococcota bacterium]
MNGVDGLSWTSVRTGLRGWRVQWLSRGLLVSGLVGLGLGSALYAVYGPGQPYTDRTGPALLPESSLEVVLQSDEPFGNVATSSTGLIFYTIHPEVETEGPKLWVWDGEARLPFPDTDAQARLVTPLGLVLQDRTLWVIDHGGHGSEGAKLLGYDIRSKELKIVHEFSDEVAPLGSYLQDLQVSDEGMVFVADVSFWRQDPALIVLDLQSGKAKRFLTGHPSVQSQGWIIANPERTMRFFGGVIGFPVGIDGLALTPDNSQLWFGAMANDSMYRLPTSVLRVDSTEEAVRAALVRVGLKPLNDGLSVDVEGHVLITDVEHQAILRQAPNGDLQTLIRSERMRWPDGLSFGPDGWLYVTDSALPHLVLQPERHWQKHGPFAIFRFKPPARGRPGR